MGSVWFGSLCLWPVYVYALLAFFCVAKLYGDRHVRINSARGEERAGIFGNHFTVCLHARPSALLILAPFSARGPKAKPAAQEGRGGHSRRAPKKLLLKKGAPLAGKQKEGKELRGKEKMRERDN